MEIKRDEYLHRLIVRKHNGNINIFDFADCGHGFVPLERKTRKPRFRSCFA